MQLGTRWSMGGDPPSRLPATIVAAIREVEAAQGVDSARRWTLTWLEGRPIAELDASGEPSAHDDVTVIRLDPVTGGATMSAGDSGEEWLEEEL